MIEINGKYSNAKIFTDNVEHSALSQIEQLTNQPSTENSKIRIMPDVHAGKGCTIGTTMTITDKVIPNLVGVDIGCGIFTVKLKETRINLPELDSVIHRHIPAGRNVHTEDKSNKTSVVLSDLKCYGKAKIKDDYIYKSIGSLGGGNHFIEVDKDENDNLYLVVHSGSRNLGVAVCKYYQQLAYDILNSKFNKGGRAKLVNELITKLKSEGREKEIQNEIANFYKNYTEDIVNIPFELCYLEGENFNNYIHDMKLVQQFARDNRAEILRIILKKAKLHTVEQFDTIHNYIDTDNMILRKGSISAQKDEKVLIPMNMRDGSLICVGKGNPDWNFSAPHGAGRIMSRNEAKQSISMNDYRNSMKGIYTTCVNTNTVDESVFAYKPMEEIMNNIKDTVDIINIIKPIYNFKAND